MFMVAELNQIIETSESINIYDNGKISVYGQGEMSHRQIVNSWIDLTENSHEMPAYGVSLNRDTIQAMNNGLWVEFVFNKQIWHNEMPFKKLLIKVEKQSQGFNIIRYNSEKGYDGRCYYIDLIGKDMTQFYELLINL